MPTPTFHPVAFDGKYDCEHEKVSVLLFHYVSQGIG